MCCPLLKCSIQQRLAFRSLVCVMVLLVMGGCRSALLHAAAVGDADAVQREIGAGVSRDAQNAAADIAWRRGNMSVLNALAQAGAAVAPSSVAGQVLLLQEDWYGAEQYTNNARVFSDIGAEHVADCFVQYWVEDDDWQEHRAAYLKHCVWDASGKRGVVVQHPIGRRRGAAKEVPTESLHYLRTGVRSAEVTMRFVQIGASMLPVRCSSKYELSFESPTSGTYRHLYAENTGLVCQYAGRFWLR